MALIIMTNMQEKGHVKKKTKAKLLSVEAWKNLVYLRFNKTT